MIFLGSWRSTLIITVSIPLAVLSSLTALSLLGQTINVMTLGGLALAVGILVDDATVTIENINRHMEHGEDILTAITNGAQEIMPPATVALFCICIAFVPLLTLGGVAGYLFRPLAMAVVFAMIASYILTYTLVPTMAHFLLKNQHPHGAGRRVGRAAPRRLFWPLSARVRALFRAVPAGLPRASCDWRLRHRFVFAGGFVCFALLSLGLAPVPRTGLFPFDRLRRDQDPHESADGNPNRGNDAVNRSGRTEDPFDHSSRPGHEHRQQHRPAGQRHQPFLREHGNDRRFRRRHAHQPERGTDLYRRLCENPARAAPEGFPGHDLLVPSGGHRQPDSQLRLAGAARRPDRRQRPQREPRLRDQTAREDSPCSGHRRSPHPGSFPGPRSEGRLQPRVCRRRRAHGERRLDQPSDDSCQAARRRPRPIG